MDINLFIPRLLLVYMAPGLLPTLVIFSANIKLFQSQNSGIAIFALLVVDIILSIFLENIRFGFLQKFSINERNFFSKNLSKFFSLVKNDEVVTLNASWKHNRSMDRRS